MAGKKKLVCTNCGEEFKAPHRGATPKSEGWLTEEMENGLLFCCCVCKAEYGRKQKTKSKRK